MRPFWNEHALAALPTSIRFGTSSWTYPGWQGLVYHQTYKNEADLKKRSFAEYCACPLFRTVGIDSSFYTPTAAKNLAAYASTVPPNFRWASKVWERITIPRYPTHARYGKDAGAENPDFLNSGRFIEAVLTPYLKLATTDPVGPFIFQFPYIHPDIIPAEGFLNRLRAFLQQLPATFRYAIEIRNPNYLTDHYFGILNECGVTHCFNHWHFMPPLREQMKKAAAAGGLTAPFYTCRILTPHGVSYENAVKLFSPYAELRRPNPEMREDVTRLVRRALERDIDAYILVNNRSEGCAPLTIAAILDLLNRLL